MISIDLSNLASGLVGAIIALLGKSIASWLNHKRERKAAGRALFAELCGNHKALQDIGRIKPAGYREDIWERQKPELTLLLEPDELEVVINAYAAARQLLSGYEFLDKYYLIAEMRGPLQSVRPDQLYLDPENVIKEMQKGSEKARKQIEEACKVLRRRVYRRFRSKQTGPGVAAQHPH
jgi:hypothetical protein